MNGPVCVLLLIATGTTLAATIPFTSKPLRGTREGDDTDTFLLEPEPILDGKAHDLKIGQCEHVDELLHAETIVVNNDGTSRVLADIRVNIQAPVNITCFKVLDQMANSSAAIPTFRDGGLGHNYVVLGFNTLYGYGFKFLIEIYGHGLS